MNQNFRSAFLAFAASFIFISLALAKAERAQTKKNTTQGEIEAYFHFETPNGQTTIYNKAGYDYNSCKKDSSCEARAWVTSDNSKIVDYNTPPKRIFLTDENGLVINPNTNEPMFNEYIEVTIEYTPVDKSKKILEKKKITGWVDADYIRYRNKNEEKERPYYDDQVVDLKLPKQKDKPLPKRWESCEKPTAIEIPHLNEIAESMSTAQQPLLLNKKVAQEAEVLTKELNICIEKNPKELLDYPDNGELTYDKYVLPKVKNKKVPNFDKEILVGKDKKGNEIIGKVPMTQKDLIAIDAVARTLYGEAARCFKKGPQHAAAIAAVINNRTQFLKSDFIQGNHSSDKEINAKLATSPRQFHVWSPTYTKEEKDHSKKTLANGALLQALCPVKPENAKKSKPHTSSDEENAWNTAVMVATELVLHGPTSFKNKTKNVTEKTLFYVSYIRFEEKRATAIEVSPLIGGHKLSEKGCVKLYQDDSVKN